MQHCRGNHVGRAVVLPYVTDSCLKCLGTHAAIAVAVFMPSVHAARCTRHEPQLYGSLAAAPVCCAVLS